MFSFLLSKSQEFFSIWYLEWYLESPSRRLYSKNIISYLKDGSQGRAKNINLYIKDRVILSGGKTIYASQLKEKSGGLDLNSAGQVSAQGHQAVQSQESVQNFNAALIAEETLTAHGKMKELVLDGGTIGGLKKTSLNMEKLTTRAPLDKSKATSHFASASGSTAGAGSASYQKSLQESQLLNSPNRILGEEVEATADRAETQGLVIEGTKKRVLNLGDWTDRPVEEFEKEKHKAVSGGYAPTALLPVTGYGGETHHATHQTWHTTLLPSEEANEGPLPGSVVTDPSQTRQVHKEKKSSHRFGFVIPNLEKIREDGLRVQEVFQDLREEDNPESEAYYDTLEGMAHIMEEEGLTGEEQQALLEEYIPEVAKAISSYPEKEEKGIPPSSNQEKGKEKEPARSEDSVSDREIEALLSRERRSLPPLSSGAFLGESSEDPYRDLRAISSGVSPHFKSEEDFNQVGTREVPWDEHLLSTIFRGAGEVVKSHEKVEDLASEFGRKILPKPVPVSLTETEKAHIDKMRTIMGSTLTPEESYNYALQFKEWARRRDPPLIKAMEVPFNLGGQAASEAGKVLTEKVADRIHSQYPNLPKEDIKRGVENTGKAVKLAFDWVAFGATARSFKAFLRAEKLALEVGKVEGGASKKALMSSAINKSRHIEKHSASANAQVAINNKMSALQFAQRYADRTKILGDGRIRYYTKEKPSKKGGKTRGASYVTEYNPKTGRVKAWMECYDHSGKVNRVHPKMINGQTIVGQHYPLTQKEIEILSKADKGK